MDFSLFDAQLGLPGVLLFWWGNRNKTHIYWVMLSVAGLLVSLVFNVFWGPMPMALYIYAISATGLVISYSLRFVRKSPRQLMDYPKLAVMLLLITLPDSFLILIQRGTGMEETAGMALSDRWVVPRVVIYFMLVMIYVYDRWILKIEPMNRKFLTPMIVQSLAILVLLMFSIFQKREADFHRSQTDKSETAVALQAAELRKCQAEVEVLKQNLRQQ